MDKKDIEARNDEFMKKIESDDFDWDTFSSQSIEKALKKMKDPEVALEAKMDNLYFSKREGEELSEEDEKALEEYAKEHPEWLEAWERAFEEVDDNDYEEFARDSFELSEGDPEGYEGEEPDLHLVTSDYAPGSWYESIKKTVSDWRGPNLRENNNNVNSWKKSNILTRM